MNKILSARVDESIIQQIGLLASELQKCSIICTGAMQRAEVVSLIRHTGVPTILLKTDSRVRFGFRHL